MLAVSLFWGVFVVSNIALVNIRYGINIEDSINGLKESFDKISPLFHLVELITYKKVYFDFNFTIEKENPYRDNDNTTFNREVEQNIEVVFPKEVFFEREELYNEKNKLNFDFKLRHKTPTKKDIWDSKLMQYLILREHYKNKSLSMSQCKTQALPNYFRHKQMGYLLKEYDSRGADKRFFKIHNFSKEQIEIFKAIYTLKKDIHHINFEKMPEDMAKGIYAGLTPEEKKDHPAKFRKAKINYYNQIHQALYSEFSQLLVQTPQRGPCKKAFIKKIIIQSKVPRRHLRSKQFADKILGQVLTELDRYKK